MLRDVFYFGAKPNVHPREKFASSLNDARKQCTTEHFWVINEYCDYKNFDWDYNFDFHPDEDVWAEDHINVWPSQHQKDSGTWLCANNDSEIRIYRNDVGTIKRKPTQENWECIDGIPNDLSWHPDPTDPPYIYVWGNQWYAPEQNAAVRYVVPGATQYKFMEERLKRKANMSNWIVLDNVIKFDFSWMPHPDHDPYIYVWGNQWHSAETRASLKYVVPGATQVKYMTERVTRGPVMDNWIIGEDTITDGFDFSWEPDPGSPPYIYQFNYRGDTVIPGPKYRTPNSTEDIVVDILTDMYVSKYVIETTLEDLVKQHPNEIFWATRKNIDYSKFDFTWRPGLVDILWELDYVHVFGSTESEETQTYFVCGKKYLDGYTSFKFVETVDTLDEKYLSKLFIKPDIFFIDKGNQESSARFIEIQNKLTEFRITKTRYLNSWVDTISRCVAKSTTDVFWVLNSELDYTDFDFEYYPNVWQMNMVQVFGTQWSHWGTTFMINKERFLEDTKYVKVIEHLSNLNFVKSIRSKATSCVHDIVLIDHGNKETDDVLALLKSKTSREIKVVPYSESYIKTLDIIASNQQPQKEQFLWICSSVCDYTYFDFSYICDPFAREQLHVFPSATQKFGDTFFVNAHILQVITKEFIELEECGKINYNATLRPIRLPEPTIIVDEDTHVNAVDQIEGFPYATFITKDNEDIQRNEVEPMCLWSPKTKNIIITSTGATKIVVPKEAKEVVNKELYAYPYIKKIPKFTFSKPLDIVFLSNGEQCAEDNWNHLNKLKLKNRIVRVDGVKGRTTAYHAAVNASETPWCFTVFAKLKVNETFDWNWQPDRMQLPKHYIFHAINPVNGLIYGHQAMIAYNKKITLGTTEIKMLDFTLSSNHEVVPMISGTATYDIDPWTAWRTAFRETVKLLYYQSLEHNSDTELRLNAWLEKSSGDYGLWSVQGARDAKKYFEEVSGNYDDLLLTFEWKWLQDLWFRTHFNG